jgi:signal peptidase II
MRMLTRVLLVSMTLSGCVGCDQASKAIARALLGGSGMHSYGADVLRLVLVENPGSFLSLGASLSPPARFWIFILAVGALLAGLVGAALFMRLEVTRVVALCVIAGGGLSNLIDRLLQDGRVTDFLNLGIGALRTGIFNVADMMILGGAAVLVVARRPSASG